MNGFNKSAFPDFIWAADQRPGGIELDSRLTMVWTISDTEGSFIYTAVHGGDTWRSVCPRTQVALGATVGCSQASGSPTSERSWQTCPRLTAPPPHRCDPAAVRCGRFS